MHVDPYAEGVSARKTGNSVRVPLETASFPPEAAVDVQHWVLDSFAELQQLRAALFAALNGEPMPPGGELDAVPEQVAIVATELGNQRAPPRKAAHPGLPAAVPNAPSSSTWPTRT